MGNQNHKNKNEDYEKDMEFWEGEKYVGVGIKRMKAYKCDLNIKALQKRRKKFWKLKLNEEEEEENYSNWSIIQNALTYDDPRDILYLKHFGIEPINGCINECKDKNGIIYKIPNYCINDPYFEREKKECDINLIESETKKIKIYGYGDFKEFYLEISNKLTGKELKDLCRKNENLDENVKLRIFVFGVEIKDEDILYQHNLTEDKPIYLVINNNK